MASRKPISTNTPIQPDHSPKDLDMDLDMDLDASEVAEVAYLLWLDRGGEHGQDEEDWRRAVEIVRDRNSR